MEDNMREENLQKIRKLRETADVVGQGSKHTNVLTIDYVSEETGIRYEGKIQVHRPNIKEYMKMGALKGYYLKQFMPTDMYVDPEYIDNTIKVLAQALATVKVVVDKCPEWLLRPEESTDMGIIFHVFHTYNAWLDSFRRDNLGENTGDSQDNGTEESVVDTAAVQSSAD